MYNVAKGFPSLPSKEVGLQGRGQAVLWGRPQLEGALAAPAQVLQPVIFVNAPECLEHFF